MPYVGRFAPSPSGDLHFGSLVTALASFLQAKHNNGIWKLRIDDVDSYRVVKGATYSILKTLEAYQLFWDDEIYYQSQHNKQYQAALDQIKQQTFFCVCTRKNLKSFPVYPGTCRNKNYTNTDLSIRCKVQPIVIKLHDLCQKNIQINLKTDIGDFILKRIDGVFSYQIATVIDDDIMQITEIIRGYDLFKETAKQNYLQQLLGIKIPSYGHIPLVTNSDGQKLSKQTFAKTLSSKQEDIKNNLLSALRILNHNPTNNLDSITDILNWGIANWNIKNINIT